MLGDEDEASLENYLRWRGWDIERVLREFKLGDDLAPSAAGLLSHTLTFPLTLGRHASEFSSSLLGGKGHLRICCVGARAECTLPDDYWREFLVAAMHADNADNANEQSKRSFHCTIDFVGPDVPSHLESNTISLVDSDDDACAQQQWTEYTLTMNYHTSFLHEVVLKFLKSSRASNGIGGDVQASDGIERIRRFWDGYALFNPGIGHPNLQKQWGPTLKFLLGTGKPTLFTAHSSIDAERDRAVLEKLLVGAADNCSRGGSVEYSMNPYASRMGFVDPFSSASEDSTPGDNIVRPNHSAFMLR